MFITLYFHEYIIRIRGAQPPQSEFHLFIDENGSDKITKRNNLPPVIIYDFTNLFKAIILYTYAFFFINFAITIIALESK